MDSAKRALAAGAAARRYCSDAYRNCRAAWPDRKPAAFVHLRVKSAYSLLEGAVRPKELAELARDTRMPAVAVTDINNLFGVYEIGETLAKAGVQPIVGALLSVESGRAAAPVGAWLRARTSRRTCRCWCRTRPAIAISPSFSAPPISSAEPGDWPHVKADMLAAHAEGLIALTGGPGGPLNQLLLDGQNEAAGGAARPAARRCFGDRLYVELQRHGLAEERADRSSAASISPMPKSCRSSPPMTCISARPTCMRPMTRCSASPMALSSRRTTAAA